jgi:hypothetical protein
MVNDNRKSNINRRGGGRGGKRLTFDLSKNRVHEIEHCNDLNPEQAVWITPDEYAEYKQAFLVIVRKMMKSKGPVEETENVCCRGLGTFLTAKLSFVTHKKIVSSTTCFPVFQCLIDRTIKRPTDFSSHHIYNRCVVFSSQNAEQNQGRELVLGSVVKQFGLFWTNRPSKLMKI